MTNENANSMIFPSDFLWGTATAAHQIEGGNDNNNWALFEKEAGRIHNGDISGFACDHWNRFEEDCELMTQLNQNSYRMSMEWSRIFRDKDTIDDSALDRYEEIIDTLIARNITPFVTLHHFTYPIWWDRQGGLMNRSNSHLEHFARFCRLLGERFKDKVVYWNTINEIDIVAICGFFEGSHPPAKKSFAKTFKATNTLLKMHQIAYQCLKEINPDFKVGLVHNMPIVRPLRNNSLTDKLTAKLADYMFNGSVINGLKKGKLIGQFLGSEEGLKDSTDFLGLNFYHPVITSPKIPGLAVTATEKPLCGKDNLCVGLDWEAYPEGMLLALRRFNEEFPGLPMYITENGIGTENDEWRQKLMIDHLKICHQAIQEGIDLKGYFHWSLLDNFEWAEGYSSRFGLVEVDFNSQKRTVKGSGTLYGDISRNNGLTSEILDKFPEDIYRPDFAQP